MEDVKSSLTGEAKMEDKVQNLIKFDKPSQCQSLQLSAHVKATKV